jgi:hypothetical protein
LYYPQAGVQTAWLSSLHATPHEATQIASSPVSLGNYYRYDTGTPSAFDVYLLRNWI